MDKETLRMQMLAGVITESQYAIKLKEMEGDPNDYAESDDWNMKAMDNHIKAMEIELGDEYEKSSINVGWGVDENSLTISSKIYGNPTMVFRTMHNEGGDIEDQELTEY
jgi:hypothetical protein